MRTPANPVSNPISQPSPNTSGAGHTNRPTRKQQQRAFQRRLNAIRLAISAAFARRDIDEVLRLQADFAHVMRCSLER